MAINVPSTRLSLYFWSLSSKNALNTIPIFALISAGTEDAGCPSLSQGLQPLEGIWGHCEPLCCPAGSAAHCSLPAFTGFPVSGYHVLCLFSLLFVCVHPIGLVRRPPKRLAEERMALSLLQAREGGWGVGVASQGWLTCIFTTRGMFALWPSLIRNAAWTCVFWQSFLNSPSLYQVDGKELHRPPAHPTPPPTESREPQSIPN